MGYALLYESMLDSVLVARDRFLRPSAPIEQRTENDRIGIMAPSQTKIMFGLCDGNDIYKERIAFWNDVHGKF
jgi:type I protein arginine methyltransferase